MKTIAMSCLIIFDSVTIVGTESFWDYGDALLWLVTSWSQSALWLVACITSRSQGQMLGRLGSGALEMRTKPLVGNYLILQNTNLSSYCCRAVLNSRNSSSKVWCKNDFIKHHKCHIFSPRMPRFGNMNLVIEPLSQLPYRTYGRWQIQNILPAAHGSVAFGKLIESSNFFRHVLPAVSITILDYFAASKKTNLMA
jgi:hypothetical protein